jgi:hypothetical protein
MNPNDEVWCVSDIVIHESDEPLHRNGVRMLMVVLAVDTGMMVVTKYIYPESMKDIRDDKDIRRHIQEELPILLEKQTFQEFRNKCKYKHEQDMRKVYVNHFTRLYDPERRNIVVTKEDEYEARRITK